MQGIKNLKHWNECKKLTPIPQDLALAQRCTKFCTTVAQGCSYVRADAVVCGRGTWPGRVNPRVNPHTHETFNQCWNNVGPASQTLDQHCTSIESMSRVTPRTHIPAPPPPVCFSYKLCNATAGDFTPFSAGINFIRQSQNLTYKVGTRSEREIPGLGGLK